MKSGFWILFKLAHAWMVSREQWHNGYRDVRARWCARLNNQPRSPTQKFEPHQNDQLLRAMDLYDHFQSKLNIQKPWVKYIHFIRLATFQGVMNSISYYYSLFRFTSLFRPFFNCLISTLEQRLHFKFRLPVKRCAQVFLSLLAWSYNFRELLLEVGFNLCLMVLTPCLESGLKKITIGNHWV